MNDPFRHSGFMTFVLLATLLAGAVFAQAQVPELKASMIVLGVSDLSRSVKFYRDTLALPAAPAPGDLPIFQAGQFMIVLNGNMSPKPGGFEVVFSVESVSTVRNQMTDRGCKFVGETREVAPNRWVATFTDPDGHHLTLFGGR